MSRFWGCWKLARCCVPSWARVDHGYDQLHEATYASTMTTVASPLLPLLRDGPASTTTRAREHAAACDRASALSRALPFSTTTRAREHATQQSTVPRFCLERCAHAKTRLGEVENRFDSRRLHRRPSCSDLEVPVSGSWKIWAPTTSLQGHDADLGILRCSLSARSSPSSLASAHTDHRPPQRTSHAVDAHSLPHFTLY